MERPKEEQRDKQCNVQKKNKGTNNAASKWRTKGQTMQCPKEEQKDKQWSSKRYTESQKSSNTNTTKNGEELGYSGMVSSSGSTSATYRFTVNRQEHHRTYKQLSIICFILYYILERHSLGIDYHVIYVISVTNDHGYVPLVKTSRSFSRSWPNTGLATRLTRRLSLVEQELLTLPEHLSSPPDFNGVRVTQSLVLCVMFCRSLFVLLYFFFWPLCCLFFFDIGILITSLIFSISS